MKSAGRLRVESSVSPRPRTRTAKSPRPTSHKSDSTNYSVAQYKLKEDNTKVQMTPYGLRRVRNYERPTYGRCLTSGFANSVLDKTRALDQREYLMIIFLISH